MMVDKAIEEFFDQRASDYLKKNLKANMGEVQLTQVKQECADKFDLENWLPNAAKRATQIRMSSHPCTFSHPSAQKNKNGKTTAVVASAERADDGYIRTGNVNTESDALGNAAALDVFKLLSLVLADGDALMDHLERDSAEAQNFFSISNCPYEELKDGFMSVRSAAKDEVITSSKIKQVYFPVKGGYHLLSVLTPSGILFELRHRVDAMHFNDHALELRKMRREGKYSEDSYKLVPNLTVIGYGGTKPQNISVLNNQNGGRAYLLASTPPKLAEHSVLFPSKSFFTQSISFYNQSCRQALNKLHLVFLASTSGDIPLKNLEKARDERLDTIMDYVFERLVAIRGVAKVQYREQTSGLPTFQKIWLADHDSEAREQKDEWLDEVCDEIARWIASAYKKAVKRPVELGAAERKHILMHVRNKREIMR